MALLQKITKSFQNLGYTHWDKSKITDANIFNQHKIIKSILFDSLQKINPQIAEILKENSLESENLYRLFDESFLNEKFFKSRNTKIININKNIIQSLIVPFKYKSLNGSVYKMKWIDFDNCENNNFIAYIDHRDEEDPLSIPEIVIFVNGIPLVVGQTEKYSFDSHDGTLKNSSRKIKTLISNRNKFLSCNFFSFITNDTTTKVSAITSAKDEFHFWRDDVEGKNQIEFVIQDLFQKEKFLDIIQNFIFFNDSEDKPRKIFARYYQYYAVKKSAEIVRKKIIVEKEQSDNKVGIVWHTQGSGKSLSMVMLAKNIRDFLPNITIVVLTDRIDLDQQIFNNFKKFQKYLGKSSLINFENIQQLKEELKNSKKKSIYFTTIQKFSNNVGFLNDRQDILIITDEAHRSHQEDDASEKISFQLEKGLSKTHSYSSTLKMALPNAKFIGFTGTPIESDDRDTRNVFGDHIHVYAWNQATEDGAVVELRYENVSTLINFNVSDQTLKLIEEENEKENQIIRDQLSTNREETAIKVKNILKTQVLLNKSHWENLERIKLVAQHFVRHYEKRSRALKGKALFAVQSKKIADLYKQEILKLRPEWRNHIEVIVTPDSNSNSSNSTDQPRSKIWNQKIINSFKRPDSLHKILIVVDMLLTGYDVPALDVIYLDKNLRKHSLMQAIARVNRKYVDDKDYALKKAYGLIVSYINITDNLNEALRLYSHHSKTKYKPIRNAKQNFSDVEIKDILMNKINNFYLHILGKDDYQKFDESTTRDERFERLKDLILNTDMEKYFLEDFKLISSEIKK
ncbi:type I restriction endonuclease subunit R [Mycoplasmoides fastidiosum]|nr:HsdR family type I site-specific deoxyribonuclease [Mycoplasmoides fastidiosum]UUD37740.1 HsdR family type I site-specific deoxyribonuclease [Mycoplasmoides fastidiosum]